MQRLLFNSKNSFKSNKLIRFIGTSKSAIRATKSTKISPLYYPFRRHFAIKTINVPFMGDSISEGKVLEFSKAPGDTVDIDEVVAVVETDKTSLEIRAPEAGTIKEFLQSIDTNVKVDSPLFTMDTSPQVDQVTKKPAEKMDVKMDVKPEEKTVEKPVEKPVEKNQPEPEQIKPKNESDATNRMTKNVPLSRMRIKIAKRLKESQNTTASLTTFNKIDCTKLIQMRNEYKDMFLKTTSTKLGFMSTFVKASTLALKQFPALNAYFDIENEQIIMHNFMDISVAVASPRGLVVPVLRNTETMGFADIEGQIKKYATDAKEGKLKLSDMEGGTFTISNSGVYKSLIGTPIINPPQAAVLGLYGIEDTPLAIDKKVEIRPVMQIALTYDHRVVDGREAVLFLRAVKDYVEDPITMLFN